MSLANEFETCQGLWEIAADRATLLEVADSPLQTRIHLSTGQRIPAQIGAMGRCIAAAQHASPDEMRRSLSGLRWQAHPSFEDYASIVEQRTEELRVGKEGGST